MAEDLVRARSVRRRVVALVGLWTAVMLGAAVATGCYTHNCDGDVLVYGRSPGEGQLLDANTWQSSPVDGEWIPFPRQRLWIIELRDLGDRVPAIITPYVSADSNPLAAGGNFVIGAGNIAELSGAEKGRIVIKNGTCADYYLRLVVEAPPRPSASAPAAPAVPTADASASDAEAGP